MSTDKWMVNTPFSHLRFLSFWPSIWALSCSNPFALHIVSTDHSVYAWPSYFGTEPSHWSVFLAEVACEQLSSSEATWHAYYLIHISCHCGRDPYRWRAERWERETELGYLSPEWLNTWEQTCYSQTEVTTPWPMAGKLFPESRCECGLVWLTLVSPEGLGWLCTPWSLFFCSISVERAQDKNKQKTNPTSSSFEWWFLQDVKNTVFVYWTVSDKMTWMTETYIEF